MSGLLFTGKFVFYSEWVSKWASEFLSLSASRSRSPVAGPSCCVDFFWWARGALPAPVWAVAVYVLFQYYYYFLMLFSHCGMIYTCIFYIWSDVVVYMFALSLSLLSLSCLSLLPVLYPANSQQEGSSLQVGSCSRFLPANREFFLATVLAWGFQLWVSDSVKHLKTIFL